MSMPDPFPRTNLYLSAGCVAVAAAIALAWAPLDTDTGMIETVRRRVSIGDALAPTLAAGFIGLGGVLVFFQKRDPLPSGVSVANLRFLAAFLGMFAVGFALMRWTGPLAVAVADMFTDRDMTYRALRDTGPWKYIGFLTGGTFLVATMIAVIEGRLTRRAVLIAVVAISALIALYDLPFDDFALPPNGDV